MNRLDAATSPYLLQHRDNPVDWWEWGEAALDEARARNVPILLSIGYAACHWCHVMAHESFENPDIAALMNSLFVNIKVDREERPDVDHVYMSALHALGQRGGWPLTMFLTPSGKPFWGGTYFPPASRHGSPGFPDVLREIARLYREEPDRVAQNREALTELLRKPPETGEAGHFGAPHLDQVATRLVESIDPVDGGLRGAPKFPNPALLELLWRAGERTGEAHYHQSVMLTLRRMARGGIRDHLGGGFARYSVDERWLVPHFEKMLYDNAQLLELLALGAARSGDALLRVAATDLVAWLTREMVVADGAFAASLDADSEGEEGRFYVWTRAEVDRVLGPEDGAIFARHYDIHEGGNWEGHAIPNRLDTPDPDAETAERLGLLRARLLEARGARVRPGLDDKVLADWNGLMIAALARAAALLDEPGWAELAERAFGRITVLMERDGRLGHSWRDGRLLHPGFALDHAAMARAGVALYQANGSIAAREAAIRWADAALADYRDPRTGTLAMTNNAADTLVARPRPTHDDAIPNANGVLIDALWRLGGITGAARWREEAETLLQAGLGAAARAPLGHAGILNALDLRLRGADIVVAGARRDALLAAARKVAFTSRVVVEVVSAEGLPDDHPARAQVEAAGEGAAFVCAGGRCSLPVHEADAVAALVDAMTRPG